MNSDIARDPNDWRNVFFGHLDELTRDATDDAIVENIRGRFSLSKSDEEHIRSQATRWREEDKGFYTLFTDGSLRKLP